MSLINFNATVIKGLGNGKKLGFPTANLEIPKDFGLPYGVYAVSILVKGQKYKGAMHYGERTILNKEFPDQPGRKWVSLEVHILHFDQDIVGESVAVTVVKKIREVEKFTNWDELKKRIEEDVKEADNKDPGSLLRPPS